jgi:hypothetical protein
MVWKFGTHGQTQMEIGPVYGHQCEIGIGGEIDQIADH